MARTSKAASPIGGSTQPPGKIEVTLTVNGVEARLQVAPWTTLLDALRDHLDLTGTKKGCDHGQCGACTVLVDDRRINSFTAASSGPHGSLSSATADMIWPDVQYPH